MKSQRHEGLRRVSGEWGVSLPVPVTAIVIGYIDDAYEVCTENYGKHCETLGVFLGSGFDMSRICRDEFVFRLVRVPMNSWVFDPVSATYLTYAHVLFYGLSSMEFTNPLLNRGKGSQIENRNLRRVLPYL